jgi:tRNA-specific 2-thiouridylase
MNTTETRIDPRKTRVLVAMSGGVDSSVAAALLARQGYDVVGVTMNVWPEQDPNAVVREDACCSLSAAEDARRVAAQLGIPHYVLNLKETFAEKVMGLFFEEYARGRTPNPCVRCNQFIKFDALWPKAQALDADYIATGHYARVAYDTGAGRYLLRQAVDARKDQSYVLYPLDQAHLARTMLPLGGYQKPEIRQLARDLNLVVANKLESQEICFINHGHYSDQLAERFPGAMRPGPLVTVQGATVGEHAGVGAYTVGQRKGLGVALNEPAYVVGIKPETNTVVVGPECALYAAEALADEVMLTSARAAGELDGRAVLAKIRYKSEKMPARAYLAGDDRIRVVFDKPQRAVTPGQAIVLYDDDVVLAGATIGSTIPVKV